MCVFYVLDCICFYLFNQAQETRRRTDFGFDLWNDDDSAAVKDIKANEWLDKGTKVSLHRQQKESRAIAPMSLFS